MKNGMTEREREREKLEEEKIWPKYAISQESIFHGAWVHC